MGNEEGSIHEARLGRLELASIKTHCVEANERAYCCLDVSEQSKLATNWAATRIQSKETMERGGGQKTNRRDNEASTGYKTTYNVRQNKLAQ